MAPATDEMSALWSFSAYNRRGCLLSAEYCRSGCRRFNREFGNVIEHPAQNVRSVHQCAETTVARPCDGAPEAAPRFIRPRFGQSRA